MKALVISDRAEIIDFVTPILKDKGFDLIHYRWIIKALDNIEEIQPDVIVLSAGEYPRHWKTLAGFVQSGIGGNDVKIYLYEETPLSDEDQKKYIELGITGCFNQITDEKLSFFAPAAKSATIIPQIESELPSIGSFLLCETDKGRMLSGKVNKLEEKTLVCTLDFPSKFESSSISVLTTFINNQIDDYDGAVIRQFDSSKNQLVLEIQ